jgi:8-oxo-dGTP pyrophosphatase MutT (NUDIX family)
VASELGPLTCCYRFPDANRADAIMAVVADFVPQTGREVRSKVRILSELDRLVCPTDRHADAVHVTGSAIVVGPRGTVLHRHKSLGIWAQPGGHIDAGEMPWDAAVRETLEETGLTTRHLLAVPTCFHLDVHPAGDHVHLDLRFLLEAEDVEPTPAPGESQDVTWFSWEEALSLADAALVDGLVRARMALERKLGPP